MNIRLENIGKRYHRDWILKGITTSFLAEERIAVLGQNGSGKSTFLRIVSGLLTPSEGQITWEYEQAVPVDEVYRKVAWAAPYLSLYEDYTLAEAIQFQAKFRPWINGLNNLDIPSLMGLVSQTDRPIRQFSSGMKQRVKLAFAILSDVPLLLLDEPSSHLDARSVGWFLDLLKAWTDRRIVFIASNQEEREVAFCDRVLDIAAFKS